MRLCVLSSVFAWARIVLASLPSKIYGVNIGGWLIIEPWILPQKWLAMGGQDCPCQQSSCIATESAFTRAYPSTVDATFSEHWSTWFTSDDINEMKSYGINAVRIPVGYWIIESLVGVQEAFPKGGLRHLQRGLRDLSRVGISVILDHHALPGAQAMNEVFTGVCNSDPQFFTPPVNEPFYDARRTPGFGEFQHNFVSTMRGIELIMGMDVPGWSDSDIPRSRSRNLSDVILSASNFHIFNLETQAALRDTASVLMDACSQLDIKSLYDFEASQYRGRDILVTNFQDRAWQINDPPNPRDATRGPASYDDHLYYCPNEDAYLRHICNLDRVASANKDGNRPLSFGEWSLCTQFAASEEFLVKWADAQNLAFSQDLGWFFWNFKTEGTRDDITRVWSYRDAAKRGYLTRDPAQLQNPNVCAAYH
ncbi:glycoside hydrolase family 5 protein [Flagelloscypha sp. PMI_526]|nr:glycoside hydrolase family 5 protein [Flagelloscypha sp. PMI_526]